MKKTFTVLLLATLLAVGPASASTDADLIVKPIKSILGVAIGIPVGGLLGLLRGGASKGVEYSHDMQDHIGGGELGDTLGSVTGFTLGAVTGSVTGLLNGALTGLTKGISDPLTKESMTASGNFIDYDPYDFD